MLLHGCGGLKHESTWSRGIKPWAELFGQHGLGTAVVDSFSPRGVDQVCADTMTPARHCEQMKAAQPASAPELKLIVSPGGPHTFDMRLPDRTVLGMRPGFDAEATAGGRRQVLEFLTPTA